MERNKQAFDIVDCPAEDIVNDAAAAVKTKLSEKTKPRVNLIGEPKDIGDGKNGDSGREPLAQIHCRKYW